MIKKKAVGFWKKAMFSGLGALLPIIGSIALFIWMWKTTQIMIAPITTKVVGWFGDMQFLQI